MFLNSAGLVCCMLGAGLLALWAWLEYPRAVNPLDPPGSYEYVQRVSAGRSFVLMTTGFSLLGWGFFLILLSRDPLSAWVLAGLGAFLKLRYWRRTSDRRRWELRRSLELWIGNWRKWVNDSPSLRCYYCGRSAESGRVLAKMDSEHHLTDLYIAHPDCLARWEDRLRDAVGGWEIAAKEDVERLLQPDGFEHFEQLLRRAEVKWDGTVASLAAERLQVLRAYLESRQ